jgi:hypothetical protein
MSHVMTKNRKLHGKLRDIQEDDCRGMYNIAEFLH